MAELHCKSWTVYIRQLWRGDEKLDAQVRISNTEEQCRKRSLQTNQDIKRAASTEIVELNVQLDHVHLLIKIPQSYQYQR